MVFDTKCVACLHRCNETGKFVFDTGSKYAVCFDKKFIIMFESCHHALYSSLTNLHMWVEICYASSARQYDVTTRFL